MPCHPPKTNSDKIWSYEEYYQGQKDEENKKNGAGLHHWTGAESLEWYKGTMLRDTMHDYGDYRWRYVGANHVAVTYEGRFYNNRMHGYGSMSYPDGRVYNGLFCCNNRWGPGVEYHACLREDVGLWCGTQLLRLAWRPEAPSVAIDLVSVPIGLTIVAPHRTLLSTNTKFIGEVNSALELLKQYGCEPLAATDKWSKLYPKSCTDTNSQICHVEVFDRAYYRKQIDTLTEVKDSTVPEFKDTSKSSKESITDVNTYYAWNNNDTIVHMMKHCYKHEEQRRKAHIDLANILSGSRSSFKTAGKHELECRTLLMASYLGLTPNVAQLINESDVHPNITDMQGNSALMYAACGDQPQIMSFLVQAGAEIDGYNDACCTPLGVTLLRFALVRLGIAPSGMFQALLPPVVPAPPQIEEKVVEWHIKRDLTASATHVLQKSPSKTLKHGTPKKITSLKDMSTNSKKKPESTTKPEDNKINESDQMDSEETKLYKSMNNEYLLRVNEAFAVPTEANSIPYIFEVYDMSKDVDFTDEENKKLGEKQKKNVSNVIKETTRPSREQIWQGTDKEDNELDSKEQLKQDTMDRIMLTILQLLSDGADPRKVRCPQPSLFIATVARSADLVRHLIHFGADVNEVYPDALGYSALDVAVSGPLTVDNLEVIRSLLENGANADHRLPVDAPQVADVDGAVLVNDGPTLLHAVLGRKVDSEPDEELRCQMLELLLEHGCNPITQTKGRSAVDMAMSKNMDLFDIFIKSPKTELNAVINDSNQTILAKMFYPPFCKTVSLAERLQTLTNLLLFGADPLIKCQYRNEEYANLFVYAKKVISDMESTRKPPSPTGSNPHKTKSDTKGKKVDKSKKDETKSVKPLGGSGKSQGKGNAEEISDYKQTLDLVVECARLLYIRWLQAKLMKELIEIVDKYKHRQWNMILKEHKNKKCTGLWLTAVRCLEIWDVLKTKKKSKYNDNRILRHVLCIIHYYYKRTRKILRCPSMSAQEKALIEREVASLTHEHKLATISTPDVVPAIRPYVTPELTDNQAEKFNVCFDCALPLEDAKIPCGSCKLIYFCSFNCMKINIDRINCHPCSNYLKQKFFPTPEETETDIV